MKSRTFYIGRNKDFAFTYTHDGSLHALASGTGATYVIGGQVDLNAEIKAPTEWSADSDATGNNIKISDGEELYAGAGFGDPLIEGQADDVLWAMGQLASKPRGRLLELGCGPGFLMEELARRLSEWSIEGIDPSPVSVSQAASRGLACKQGFLDTVDLEPGFDVVVVMGNFQLHADQKSTLQGLADVSRPGAVLFLDTKNPKTFARRFASRLVSIPGLNKVGPVNAFAAHAFHGLRHCPSQDKLWSDLKAAGWVPVAMRTTAPRLLRFGNTHDLSRGLKGRIWRLLDRVDGILNEQAWIQVHAIRSEKVHHASS